jgi:hypothetical protein
MITKPQTDFIFLGLLGVLLGSTFIQAFLFSYVIDSHHYSALIAFIAVVALRFSSHRFKRYGIIFLLILGSASILNFTTYKVTFGIKFGDAVSLVVDLLFSLLFLIYIFINWKTVVIFFKGTEQEILSDRNRKIEHYRKVFAKCSDEELEKMKGDINEYPEEARVVLNELGNKLD